MANSLNFPTLQEIVNRQYIDFVTQIPQSNPFLEASWMKSFIVANAGRYFENYSAINQAYQALFFGTATDDFLDAWGATYGIVRQTPSTSSGFVTATGVIGTDILAGEILQSSTDKNFATLNDTQISATVASITSLSRAGNVVTAILDTPQPFATGISVTIGGAIETDYNGTFTIVMLDDVTFTYTINATPSTPATGTIAASANLASIEVVSEDSGSDTTLASGATLSFLSVIGGVDNGNAIVQVDGILGGEDGQSDESYRATLEERRKNPIAGYSISQITQLAKSVNGVTRVKVLSITPMIGQVTVYFVRDGDPNIIPSPAEVQTVYDVLLTEKPVTIADSDVIVNAPTPITVNFNFTTISPDTTTMRTAISDNLTQYFANDLDIGSDVLQIAYNSILYNTIDPNTGEKLQSFTLTLPAGDIILADNEVAILGGITYA